MRKASLFVFPSLFEGFPNALIESMALGLAPIGKYKNLADAVMHLLDKPEQAQIMLKKVQEWTNKTCNVGAIMGMWNTLCLHVVQLPTCENVTEQAHWRIPLPEEF